MLGTLQKFIKEQKLEELPILEEANKRMAQLEQQSAERKRAVSAAAAVAREVSKNNQKQQQRQRQQLLQSAKRPKLPENVVQSSLGQNIRSVEPLSQQLMTRQSIRTAGVPNQYQVASSQNNISSSYHSESTTSCWEPASSWHPESGPACTFYSYSIR